MGRQPTSTDSLAIFKGEQRAGVLSRIRNGCSFEFDKEFLDNPEVEGLSYCLPKTDRPVVLHGTNLHPFFAGLLPEGMRLRSLVKRIKTSEDDLFTLFAAVGTNVIGDVYVESDEDPQRFIAPRLKDIDFYDHFLKLIERDSYSIGEDAIAGVQEKISASMISFPLNIAKADKSYLLKLNPKDKPNLVRNEFQCMTLAKRCDVETAKVKIVKDRNANEGLLVERFDRVWKTEKNTFEMIHQEDACQFLDRYPADKYNLSSAEIVSGVQKFATAKQATTLKLLRLFCFSYLIGNGDLHAKNVSLYSRLKRRESRDLTPAYDLLTTYIYDDRNMAIHFDGKKDNLNRKMVLKFGERFGIPEKATVLMLDQLVSKLESNKSLLFDIPMEEKKRTGLAAVVAKRIKDMSAT